MKLLVETITGEKMSIPITGSDDICSIRSKINARLTQNRERERELIMRGRTNLRKSSNETTSVSRSSSRSSISRSDSRSSKNMLARKPPRLKIAKMTSPRTSPPSMHIFPSSGRSTSSRKSHPVEDTTMGYKSKKRSSNKHKRPPHQRRSRSNSQSMSRSFTTNAFKPPKSARGAKSRNRSTGVHHSSPTVSAPPRLSLAGIPLSAEPRTSSGKRFITAIRTPRPDDLRAQASRYGSNDRGPYVGNLKTSYTPRPTMEARHLREQGKEDFNISLKARSPSGLNMDGSKHVVLSARERMEKIRIRDKEGVLPTDDAYAADPPRIRRLASKPWFADESPGLFSKTPAGQERFTTTFRTPRPDDLRKESYRSNANDRGPYIGDTRRLAPSEIFKHIDSTKAVLKSPTEVNMKFSQQMQGQNSSAEKFRVHFSLPDRRKGLDGQKTELLSASDRRVRKSASTLRQQQGLSVPLLEAKDASYNTSRASSTRIVSSRKSSTAWEVDDD
eukprot:jgi/Bigna1/134761/aug1.26_g9469